MSLLRSFPKAMWSLDGEELNLTQSYLWKSGSLGTEDFPSIFLYSTSPFKSGEESEGSLGLTTPSDRAGTSCSQGGLCTALSGAPLPAAAGPYAPVSSTLNCYNVLHMKLSMTTIQKLQLVQNTAWAMMGLPWYAHERCSPCKGCKCVSGCLFMIYCQLPYSLVIPNWNFLKK